MRRRDRRRQSLCHKGASCRVLIPREWGGQSSRFASNGHGQGAAGSSPPSMVAANLSRSRVRERTFECAAKLVSRRSAGFFTVVLKPGLFPKLLSFLRGAQREVKPWRWISYSGRFWIILSSSWICRSSSPRYSRRSERSSSWRISSARTRAMAVRAAASFTVMSASV